jgi:very-short-patch-repair endonuclease
VTVPRNRKVLPERRRGVRVHWSDLQPDDVREMVTSPARTLVDCLRTLPFDEALAIADSALRNGSASRESIVARAKTVTGPGAARYRRIAAAADGRAANPFESTLRSISLQVRGLSFVPQLPISFGKVTVHPDLVDVDRGVVAEADSFEWHGSRRALRRDCRRYNALMLHGWMVLRFAWEDVMHDPAYVRACLQLCVVRHAQPDSRGRTAA